MKILQKVISISIIAIIFYFLIANLIANWQKIPFADLRFEFLSLLVSFAFLLIYFLVFIAGWTNMINELGESIRFSKAFWIISTSQIAKYVPGGIWYTLGRVYLCKMEKMKGEIVFLSVVVETCLLMLTNMVIFLVSINFISDASILNPLLSVAIIFVLLIILYPPLLNRLVNFALKILKRPKMKLEIKYLQMLKLSIYFLISWLAQIMGFYFLINSIYPIALSKIFNLSAVYTLSWITGFIVLFAPAGLGVREATMSLLLSPILLTPLAIATSFITRVWITIFEVVIFFAGLIVRKKTAR